MLPALLLNRQRRRGRRCVVLFVGVIALSSMLAAGTSGQAMGIANPSPGNDAYWTAERLRDAKPLALPRATTRRIEAPPAGPAGP